MDRTGKWIDLIRRVHVALDHGSGMDPKEKQQLAGCVSEGYCSLFVCRLRLLMLLTNFSRPLTHLLASSAEAAIRSRCLWWSLKRMEKQRSSALGCVYFWRPSERRPWRRDSMSSTVTGGRRMSFCLVEDQPFSPFDP